MNEAAFISIYFILSTLFLAAMALYWVVQRLRFVTNELKMHDRAKKL